jgi:hypothetical protein
LHNSYHFKDELHLELSGAVNGIHHDSNH